MPSVLRTESGYPLQGTITVHGAKNFVPKAMVATLLGDDLSQLSNAPLIRDVDIISDPLRLRDVEVNFDQVSSVMTLDPRNVKITSRLDINSLGGTSHIPILFYESLLHRSGKVFIPELGGCNTSGRPVDFYLDTLRRFGAVVERRPDDVRTCKPTEGLHDALIELPFLSAGATEQALLIAVCAEGITTLKGAAVESGIMNLINVLQKVDAIILASTDRTVRIERVLALHGYYHNILPDRTEAASREVVTLATRGGIYVRGAHQPNMVTFPNTYRKVGSASDIDSGGVRFYYPGGELNSIALETAMHPGLMTDWQQPLAVALTQARGLSIVHKTVHENRFGFTKAPRKMGANIQVYHERLGGTPCRFGQRNFFHSTVTSGPTLLHAAGIMVPDLRGGSSRLVAAFTTEGASTVSGTDIISRGYEHFTTKLEQLNAHVGYLDA